MPNAKDKKNKTPINFNEFYFLCNSKNYKSAHAPTHKSGPMMQNFVKMQRKQLRYRRDSDLTKFKVQDDNQNQCFTSIDLFNQIMKI